MIQAVPAERIGRHAKPFDVCWGNTAPMGREIRGCEIGERPAARCRICDHPFLVLAGVAVLLGLAWLVG